jgi:hypothetical protein
VARAAGDHHENARLPCGQHDPFQIRLKLLRREGAEGVIPAEFDQKVSRSVGQDPSDPSCAPGTRVPRHTGIENRASEAAARQCRLETRRESLGERQAVARLQRIPEDGDTTINRCRGRGRSDAQNRERPQHLAARNRVLHFPVGIRSATRPCVR